MRLYPALDVAWPEPPDEEVSGRILALVDDDGPLGVEERRPGYRLFFSSSDDRDRAVEKIRRFAPDAACDPVDVSDEDWAAKSQAGLGSVVIDRVIVCPPWDVRHADESVMVIVQPSMGFGTGHHASTRLCIRLLLQLPDLTGRSVLDVGTGSAVLAIVAAKLGARSAVAIDSDRDALQSAAENVALNAVRDRVDLRHVDLAAHTPIAGAPFDVVLANLTGAMLVRHAATLRDLAGRGGALVVSGIEAHEADEVAAGFAEVGCRIVRRADEDGWVGFTLRAQ